MTSIQQEYLTLHEQGISITEIARRFGKNKSTVSRVLQSARRQKIKDMTTEEQKIKDMTTEELRASFLELVKKLTPAEQAELWEELKAKGLI